MTWQPIKTAPKDGREVDLWVHGVRVTDARWIVTIRGRGWHLMSYRKDVTLLRANPTHWMPRPEPLQD